ncbi:MAG: exodeoxyribonuclease VII small subunit [Candidatus Aminicenantes bacterium]|jgi:exodeoxyribonuclease VII small subunit
MTEKSFENSLAELEKIVEKMEEGGLSLNESLALFEKGVKLARFLREELDKAEKKIAILLKDEQGKVKEEAFSLSEEDGDSESEENPGSGSDEEPPF